MPRPPARIPLFTVKVTAAYGPVMPSLNTLRGKPPEGYAAVKAFAAHVPGGWFVERDRQFKPPLLIVGTTYIIAAGQEVAARTVAMEKFATALRARDLPVPRGAVFADIV